MTPESHGDNYYYHLLMLYLPWRQETEDLLDSSGGTFGKKGPTSVPKLLASNTTTV